MRRDDIENLIRDFGYSVVLTVGGPSGTFQEEQAKAISRTFMQKEMMQEIRQLFTLMEDIYLDRYGRENWRKTFDARLKRFWIHNDKVKESKYPYFNPYWDDRERYYKG